MTRTHRQRTVVAVLGVVVPLLVLLAPSPSAAQSGSWTRIEQDDPSVALSGNWYANDGPNHSGGTSALTNTRGARATVTFTGTGIRWIGVRDGWSGFATVTIDGSSTLIDSYADPGGYQRVLFVVTGLQAGAHTLSVEVMHERGPGTEGSWVWVDAFEIEDGKGLPGGITAGVGRVEENNPALVYFGRWHTNGNPAHSGGGAAMAVDAGARVSMAFEGSGIAWNAYRDEWSGLARVYVDGAERATVDNYQATTARGVPYAIDGLPAGPHTLTIEVTGTHHTSAKGAWIWIDSFDVTR